MNILIVGIKEYPYGSSFGVDKKIGGGTAKQVIPLVEELSRYENQVHLIVRKIEFQNTEEKEGNLNVHRVFWINNEFLRLPIFALFSVIKTFSLRKEIDFIHTHGVFASFFTVLVKRLLNKKVISTPNGMASNQISHRKGFKLI